MGIVTVGIDLAKNIFAIHGVGQNGEAVLIKPKVRREQLLEVVASLPPCLIGMEACSGAQGPGKKPNMTGCSTAVLHLLAPARQRVTMLPAALVEPLKAHLPLGS